jgi:putative membrane protein
MTLSENIYIADLLFFNNVNGTLKRERRFIMYGMHWCGIGFGWFSSLVLIGVIIWLIFRAGSHRYYHKDHKSAAIDILKERYARGEIGKDEFEEKRKQIES